MTASKTNISQRFAAALLAVVLLLLASFCVAFAEETLEAINADLQKLEGENGRFALWSIDEKHAFQQRYLAIGAAQEHIYGLPGDRDIGQELAMNIALRSANFDSGKTLTSSRYEKCYWFVVDNPDNPYWEVQLIPKKDNAETGPYMVRIEARTAKVFFSKFDN